MQKLFLRVYRSTLFNSSVRVWTKLSGIPVKITFAFIGYPEAKEVNVKIIVQEILSTKFGMEDVKVERAHHDGKVYKLLTTTFNVYDVIVSFF